MVEVGLEEVGFGLGAMDCGAPARESFRGPRCGRAGFLLMYWRRQAALRRKVRFPGRPSIGKNGFFSYSRGTGPAVEFTRSPARVAALILHPCKPLIRGCLGQSGPDASRTVPITRAKMTTEEENFGVSSGERLRAGGPSAVIGNNAAPKPRAAAAGNGAGYKSIRQLQVRPCGCGGQPG
jgi:hypothetical protein